MTITVTLPEDITKHADPAREALEALVIEGYRTRALTSYQSRTLLGLGRYDFDGFLKQHEVEEGAYDIDDYKRDLENNAAMGYGPRS